HRRTTWARRSSRLSAAEGRWNRGSGLDWQVPPIVAHVDLARTRDLLLRVVEHLDPLRRPARPAARGEEDRGPPDRQAPRLVDQARVEVHVRIELATDEVVVRQRGLLDGDRNVEERVRAGDAEQVVGGLFDDPGARVVVLVDAVAEAHELVLAGLRLLDDFL